MKCPNCGEEMECKGNGAYVCPRCGCKKQLLLRREFLDIRGNPEHSRLVDSMIKDGFLK